MTISNRYLRQEQLPGFGKEAQQKLTAAKILVIGAGGLGVPVLQYLCGMGIGTIGIVDGDLISATNLHRQVLYGEQEIGHNKAQVAASKLQHLNSEVKLNVHPVMLAADNALELIAGYDLVVDATDNFNAHYLINDTCVLTGKPFVYGAIQQFEGQLSVFNYKDGPTYRCAFPVPPAENEIPEAHTAGILGVIPGIIGCWQALEVVKIITGTGEILSGSLKIIDFATNREYAFKITTNPGNKQLPVTEKTKEYNLTRAVVDGTRVGELSSLELFDWYFTDKEFLLLDVREPEEYNAAHLQQALSVPLEELHHHDYPAQVPLITFCRKGGRSQQAAVSLKEKNKELEVYTVTGGLEDWMAIVGNKLVV